MKIKLSRYTPRKPEEVLITPEVSTLTKITLENICLELDVIHVMIKDTILENVVETKMSLKRRRETLEDIMLMLQRMMNLPQKRTRQDSDDSSSDEEYVLISALTGTMTYGGNDWLIDSGASKHMTGFKESFVKLSEHESPHKVKLGDALEEFWGLKWAS